MAAPHFTTMPTDRDITAIEKKKLFSDTWKDIGLPWLEEPSTTKPTKKKQPKKKKDKPTIIKANFTDSDE